MIPTDTQRRFTTLLDQNRGIVGKVAFTYARTAEDRHDLEQEIAVQLWRAFPRYDPARSFATWAYRIALNVGISFVREMAHRPPAVPLDEQSVGVEPYEPDERIRVLTRLMERLDHLNRALLMLYLDDRSYRDIADVLGLTETNVATKLNRLKLRLRDEAQTEDHRS
ncbi:MAG: sigma-70 family RNA polymerase sigma factor [Fimbriiglobus sp.]|nr:sigma-70 family RNA polymerase sigma factor [Fimbriiglobus sp.]